MSPIRETKIKMIVAALESIPIHLKVYIVYCLDAFGDVFMANEPGPVVQSIVSLTSSLRGQLVKCFETL